MKPSIAPAAAPTVRAKKVCAKQVTGLDVEHAKFVDHSANKGWIVVPATDHEAAVTFVHQGRAVGEGDRATP